MPPSKGGRPDDEYFPTRAPRPVYSKHPNAKARALITVNSEVSPLLKLPPEIRNDIYSLVLGGKVLHVKEAGCAMLCKCVDIEQTDITKYKTEGTNATITQWYDYHNACRSRQASELPYSVALLRVCRQMYDEAALLPYSSNTFCLEPGFHQLNSFLRNRLPAQKKALKTVDLRLHGIVGQDPRGRHSIDGRQARLLTGLRELNVRVFFHGRNNPKPNNLWIEEQLMKLGNGRLESATVLLQSYRSGHRTHPQGFHVWSAAFEDRLVTSVQKAKMRKASKDKKRKYEQEELLKASKERREARGLRILNEAMMLGKLVPQDCR